MSGKLNRIKGSITALITLFKNGSVDEAGFKRFVEWQIAEGTDGLVPCGTTGESPTLSHAEHMRVVELCVETARGRVPVIAGAGSNSTQEAIELTRHAKSVGADAALTVAQADYLFGGQFDFPGAIIDQDEVIPGTVHLHKVQSHGAGT